MRRWLRRYSVTSWFRLGVALALLLLPVVVWGGGKDYIGGDSTQLYLVYPAQWLHGLSIGGSSYYFVGYEPQQSYLPLTVLLSAVRLVDPWLEQTVFGVVLGGGFLASSLVIRRLCLLTWPNRVAQADAAGISGALVYVLAPSLGQMTWEAIVPGFLWIVALPAVVLLLLREAESPSLRNVCYTALLALLVAPALYDAPEAIAAVVGLVGVTVLAAVRLRWRPVLRALVTVGVATGAVSLFWLVPEVYTLLSGQGQQGAAISSSTTSAAVGLVRSLQSQLSGIGQWLFRPSLKMETINVWPQLRFAEWTRQAWPVGVFLLVSTGFGLIDSAICGSRRTRAFVVCLVLLVLFEGTFLGAGVGLGLTSIARTVLTLPGLVAERNFWITDLIPFVFCMSLAFGFALCAVMVRFEAIGWKSIVVAVAVAGGMGVYDLPFVQGSVFSEPIYAGASQSAQMHGLPHSYMELLERLREGPPGSVVSFPLLLPSWTAVPTSSARSLYLGTSPVYLLAGREDFDSLSLLPSAAGGSVASEIDAELSVGVTRPFGRVLRLLGVKYAILDRSQISPAIYDRVGSIQPESLAYAEARKIIGTDGFRLVRRYGPLSLFERSSGNGIPLVSSSARSSSFMHAFDSLSVGASTSGLRGASCARVLSAHSLNSGLVNNVLLRKGQGPCTVSLGLPGGSWHVAVREANASHVVVFTGSVATASIGVLISLPRTAGTFQVVVSDAGAVAGWVGFWASVGATLGVVVLFFLYDRSRRKMGKVPLPGRSKAASLHEQSQIAHAGLLD